MNIRPLEDRVVVEQVKAEYPGDIERQRPLTGTARTIDSYHANVLIIHRFES